ncbi:hypothetical protein I8752_27280 [Nostocaceae cyanobacterium CENA369]|uniref:Uncharacterized protein n=1 Tax=Dendronalium phyllosphericum CENA369 TaxID=1725256 RepID=A0A8J7I879_9NOST|nr:type II toxin-antitoxin system RelE/ParE family toxin [Dendronalium phyllosphericum]MBH8576625.1 hypothetical protein [Dendronalium phyllosphericum CENA369]
MSYQLQLVSTAARQIEKLNPEVQQQLVMKLEKLTLNPLLEEARNIEAGKNLYVLTLNNYRLVYRIQK